jgi:hypothetical protein
MKRNTLIAAGTALVLTVCANVNLIQAQDQPVPTPNPAPTPGAGPMPIPANPGAPPANPTAPNPAMRRPVGPMGQRPLRFTIPASLRNLQDIKKGLTAYQDDLGGHKQTAIDACDKAIAELEAVMKVLPTPAPPPQRAPVTPSSTPASAPGAPPSTTPQTPVPQK